MRITKIERQKKNPRRKNIYADGEYIIGISDETLVKAGLRTGDEIGEDRLKSLLQEEETSGAKRIALRFLAHRPRTVKEVRDKLRENEFSEADISRTLEALTRSGLVNDTEFARMYVRDALAMKSMGKALLRRKLLLLGVDKTIVQEVVNESFEGVDERSAAVDAGRRFLQKSTAIREVSDKIRLRNRLSNFLARRGYSWEIISQVTRQLLNQDEE
jgi:regulatory protein